MLIDIYGDIEGNKEIINKIKYSFKSDRINIFLGDFVPNITDEVQMNNSIEFLKELLPIPIQHYELRSMRQFKSWNNKGLSQKVPIEGILNKINFIIGNKEIRLYRALLKNELKLEKEKIEVLETYLMCCISYLIIGDKLICHSFHYFTQSSLNKNKEIKEIICGHSRSYGVYKLKGNTVVRVIDLTIYYSPSHCKELIFEDFSIPFIKISSENQFSLGDSRFHTREFPLV